MNSHLPYQSKNSMQKKALRMNPDVALIAEEHANRNVTGTGETIVTAANAECIKPFVLNAGKKPPYRLNQMAADLFIAVIVFRQDGSY